MKTILTILLLFNICHAQTRTVNVSFDGHDRTPLQNAINEVASGAYTKLELVEGGNYIIDGPLSVPSNVTIDGHFATITPQSGMPVTNTALIATPTAKIHQASASINLTANSNTFSYANASQLKVGSIVFLPGSPYYTIGDGYKNGWYDVVTAITGTIVTTQHPCPKTFTATSIIQFKSASNVHIKNLRLNMVGRTGGYGIKLDNAVNSTIEGCKINGTAGTGIQMGIWLAGVGLKADRDTVTNIKDEAHSSVAYSINVEGQHDTVSNCYLRYSKHCITSGTRDYFCTGLLYENNDAANLSIGTGTVMDFHGNSTGIMRYNTIQSAGGSLTGIAIRGMYSEIYGNTITMTNPGTAGGSKVNMGAFAFSETSDGAYLHHNTIIMKGTPGGNHVVRFYKDMLYRPNLRFEYNIDSGGTMTLSNKLGNIVSYHNRYIDKGSFQAAINMSTTDMTSFHADGDVHIKYFGSAFNYSISTPATTGINGLVENDSIYIMSLANTSPQMRVNGTDFTFLNNIIFTSVNTPFYTDYSGTSGVNSYAGNVKMNGGVPSDAIGGAGTPPPPDSPDQPDPPPVDPPPGESECYFVRLKN